MSNRYAAEFTVNLRVEWDEDPEDADLVLEDQAHNALMDQLGDLSDWADHSGASDIEKIAPKAEQAPPESLE